MSEKTFQARLTEDELKAALDYNAGLILTYGIDDDKYDRFSYLSKRLLKIQKGEPEIETEKQTENDPQPEPPKSQGWL